jgi:hypothetical protein
MTRRKNLAQILLALLLLAPGVTLSQQAQQSSAEVVDRTIAVVNKRLVTWSDLDLQMRFEALENQRALTDLTATDRSAAFEHLLQYSVLREQMQGIAPVESREVNARLAELRATWQGENGGAGDAASGGANSDAHWAGILGRYGISPAELRSLVTNQLEILRFVEFQVKPLVRVSRDEIDFYYSNTLVPQVMAAGQAPAPLEQVTPEIRELLREQKTNQEMEKWLANLKAQSHVRILWNGLQPTAQQ